MWLAVLSSTHCCDVEIIEPFFSRHRPPHLHLRSRHPVRSPHWAQSSAPPCPRPRPRPCRSAGPVRTPARRQTPSAPLPSSSFALHQHNLQNFGLQAKLSGSIQPQSSLGHLRPVAPASPASPSKLRSFDPSRGSSHPWTCQSSSVPLAPPSTVLNYAWATICVAPFLVYLLSRCAQFHTDVSTSYICSTSIVFLRRTQTQQLRTPLGHVASQLARHGRGKQ